MDATSGPELVPSPEVVRASAREWHKLQLAALAFVGLCGVLTGDNGTRLPLGLQSVAGVLALLALAAAALGLLLVAVVAWPLGAPVDPASSGRRLRAGVILTCVAVTMVTLSASTGWWPETDAERPVEVGTGGGTACGEVVDSDAGWIELDVSGTVVRLDLATLTSLRPTESC
ncbi:hypothetical protein [Nocardioides sp. GXQ0305]|uniref:hypothetical protein n=1 Tax=Nocardioides sp. GXQ0305 TaxID=3423912 RepID=UPI003D7DD09B